MKVPATYLAMALTALAAVDARAQSNVPEPDWKAVEAETLRHYQAILRSTPAIRPATSAWSPTI